jgi:hypothetical protein
LKKSYPGNYSKKYFKFKTFSPQRREGAEKSSLILIFFSLRLRASAVRFWVLI